MDFITDRFMIDSEVGVRLYKEVAANYRSSTITVILTQKKFTKIKNSIISPNYG